MDSEKDNTDDLTLADIQEFVEWAGDNYEKFKLMCRTFPIIESHPGDMQTIVAVKHPDTKENPNLPEIEWFSWDGKKC